MSMEIDSLEIAIQSQAQGATKELNALYSTLGNISAALNRSASGYRSTAKEIGRVSAALQTLAKIRIPDFSKAISQVQILSGMEFGGLSKKSFVANVDINVAKTQEQIEYALENAVNGAKPDTDAMANMLIRQFRLTGGAADLVRQHANEFAEIFAKGFNWQDLTFSGDAWKQMDVSFEKIANVINASGSVMKQEVSDSFAGMTDAYEDFYEYIKNKPIIVSDALKKGIGSSEFQEMLKEYPGMLVRTAEKGAIEINSVWSEMSQRWPQLFPADIVNDADQLKRVLEEISNARSALGQTDIVKLNGDDIKNALELTNHATYEALEGISRSVREQLVNAATNNKDLMIDLEVNQDKIVNDIRSAVNKASSAANYDPVKINLRIDKQHVTNAVADELKSMDAGNLPQIADAYERLAKAIGTLYTASSNHKAINQMVNAVRRLSVTDMSQFDSEKFAAMTTSIQGLAEIGDAAQNINRLVNSLTRLANSGPSMAQAAAYLPMLGEGVRQAAETIGQANFDETSARLVAAISRLATSAGNIGVAATNLPTLTAAIRDFFLTMSQAPEVSDNTVRMTESLAQLSAKGSRVDRATSGVANGMRGMQTASKGSSHALKDLEAAMKKLLGVLGKFGKGIVQAQIGLTKMSLSVITGFRGINQAASGIGKATISLKNLLGVALGFYGIRSLFNWGKQAIELSSDLTEVQNVVENAFGKEGTAIMEDFASTSIRTFGMSELTAKQIASRYQAMGVAMGLTSNQVAEATERVADRMADSYDKTGASMGEMSMNLTRLAADMASFYNVEQETVAESLNAVYTGQTRPLRQYGLDLTQATLQEWANKQGIDAKISSMSQAEKTMLRYQYVMANTAVVQGDFARTSMTWANQIRILKQNFEVLGKTIGGTLINVFRPLVSWLNTAMAKVIAFAETIGNALGKIFGWTILHTPAGSASSGVEELYDLSDGLTDAGDSAGSTADKLDDATAAAKDLQATVLGFDQLNKLNDVADSASSGSPSSGGSGSGLPSASDTGVPDANGADFQLVQTKSWLEQYESQIDSLWELGDYIGKTLTDVLNGIDWDSVYLATSSFGSGLASFLNGLISPELFDAVAKTVANSLNTALHALDTFGSVFSWTNFGTSIGTGIRSFLENFDWELTADTFSTFVNGYTTAFYAAIQEIPTLSIGQRISNAIRRALQGVTWDTVFDAAASFGYRLADFLNGLIDEDTFAEIGTAVGNALHAELLFLNNFGEEMEWDEFGDSIAASINSFFEKFSFSKLVHTLRVWAKGMLDALIRAIKRTNWNAIGQDIGNAIKEINFGEFLEGADELISAAIQAVIDAAKGMIDPDGLGTPLTDALDNIAKSVKNFGASADWDKLASAIGKLVKALEPAIAGFAEGLVEVLGAFAEIGAGAMALIAGAFDVLANALNKLDPDILNAVGKALAFIAGTLFALHTANTIGKFIAGLGGAGSAASTAAGGGGILAGAFGLLGKILTSKATPAIAGLAFGLKNFVIECGPTQEEEEALCRSVEELAETTDLGNASFKDFTTAVQENKTVVERSKITYDNMRESIRQMAGQYGLTADEAGILLEQLNMQQTAGTNASDAYNSLVDELDRLGDGSADARDALIEGVNSGLETAKTSSNNLKDSLFGFLGGLGGQLLKALGIKVTMGTVSGALDDTGTSVDNLDGKFNTFTGTSLATYAETARTNAETMGMNIDSGLSGGITDNAGEVDSAMRKMTEDTIGTANSLWGVHSPSTVAADIGRYWDQGLANGILNNTSTVQNEMRKLMNGLLELVRKFSDSYREAGKKLANEVKAGFGSVSLRETVNKMFNSSMFSSLNRQLYNAGQSAAQSLRNGLNSVRMPSLSYYISRWDLHNLGDGGYSYTPRFSAYWYARGGFPNKGELFVANEAGPEMVGKMGRKNVVANNLQITEGIKAAVVDGMMEVAAMNRYSSEAAPSYQLTATLYTENNVALARAVDKGRLIQNDRNVNRY